MSLKKFKMEQFVARNKKKGRVEIALKRIDIIFHFDSGEDVSEIVFEGDLLDRRHPSVAYVSIQQIADDLRTAFMKTKPDSNDEAEK